MRNGSWTMEYTWDGKGEYVAPKGKIRRDIFLGAGGSN